MPHRPPRGFTLIELLIAGLLSLILVSMALAVLGSVQSTTSHQARAVEIVSQGRLAIEVMSKDIRQAGDSTPFFAPGTTCVSPNLAANWSCPAVLEPHQWRITVTRNAWLPGPDTIIGTRDDLLPLPTATLTSSAEHAVSYEFLPYSSYSPSSVGGAQAFLGHIDRVYDPLGSPTRVRLVDNVMLDDRMRVNPLDPTDTDPRFDHSLFMYHLFSQFPGMYAGDPAIVGFPPGTTSNAITPPVRFFQTPSAALPATDNANAYLAAFPVEIVGLNLDDTTQGTLIAGSPAPGLTQVQQVRDCNWIRAVHIGFKLYEGNAYGVPIEDPNFGGGLDLNPAAPGSLRTYNFESVVEIKMLAGAGNVC